MIEDYEGVRDGEVGFGNVQVVFGGIGEAFEVTYGVVGEISHRSPYEGWQVRERGHGFFAHDLGQAPERVSGGNLPYAVGVNHRIETVPVGERALGVEAEERVAAEPLGRLGALQQEDSILP